MSLNDYESIPNIAAVLCYCLCMSNTVWLEIFGSENFWKLASMTHFEDYVFKKLMMRWDVGGPHMAIQNFSACLCQWHLH